MARRRSVNVFSLSFLDAMTCGLGAVILVYMIINAAVGLHSGKMTEDLRADADTVDREVLDAYKRLVELRTAVEETSDELVTTRGLTGRLLQAVERLRVELAMAEDTSLARRESIEKLKSDLKTLDAETKRLTATLPTDEPPGDKVRAFLGDGDRQYLTGLKVGGQRILLLVDASASMLDETIVNVIRLRHMPDDKKRAARKWRQATATVDWLTTQLPRDSLFQLYTFATEVRPVVPDSDRQWLDAGDREVLDDAVERLQEVVPGGGTSLYRALRSVRLLEPRPDNVILIADGLPTWGERPPSRSKISGKDRLKLFRRAVRELPNGIPVNTILLPMEGDPMAPAAYWTLALATGGSFMSPSEDWP